MCLTTAHTCVSYKDEGNMLIYIRMSSLCLRVVLHYGHIARILYYYTTTSTCIPSFLFLHHSDSEYQSSLHTLKNTIFEMIFSALYSVISEYWVEVSAVGSDGGVMLRFGLRPPCYAGMERRITPPLGTGTKRRNAPCSSPFSCPI